MLMDGEVPDHLHLDLDAVPHEVDDDFDFNTSGGPVDPVYVDQEDSRQAENNLCELDE